MQREAGCPLRLTGLWWWSDRWRKSTAFTGLTLEEQGAYRNLLDEAHLRGGAIPNDEEVLAKACGDPRRWRRVRAKVIAHFTLTSDGWHNETLDAVMLESERRADKQRRWRLNRGNGDGNAAGNGGGNNRGSPDPDPDPVVVPTELHKEHTHALSRVVPETPERERFNAFWRVYPKKVGKDAAWKAWQLRHLSADLAATVIAALAWQVQQDNWLIEGGRFVPNPSTWINQGRWQDEPSTTPHVNNRTLAAMTATREFLDS